MTFLHADDKTVHVFMTVSPILKEEIRDVFKENAKLVLKSAFPRNNASSLALMESCKA